MFNKILNVNDTDRFVRVLRAVVNNILDNKMWHCKFKHQIIAGSRSVFGKVYTNTLNRNITLNINKKNNKMYRVC